MPKPRAVLRGPSYFGGKSANGKVGRWVVSLLPYRTMYAETHAGMLGVLLQRRPSKIELASDLDSRVVDFWRALRDEPDEMIRLLNLTELSRSSFVECLELVKSDGWHDLSLARRGWSVAAVLLMSIRSSLDSDPSCLRGEYSSTGWAGGYGSGLARLADRLPALADRIRHVRFSDYSALYLLERLAKNDDVVVYVDPPYAEANDRVYPVEDLTDLSDVLRSQKGLVAVSGYGSEWDGLDWYRHELAAWSTAGTHRKRATEVLWTNFSLAKRGVDLESWV